MKYNLSYTLTYIKLNNKVYNWINGEYIEFDDLEHPFLKIIINNTINFEKFQYQNTYDDFDWLLENYFIVTSQIEIQNIIKNQVIENNSNKYLQLTLLPAQMSCNFACTYCYEDRNQKDRMTDETKNILLKYIQNNQELKYLQIEWFGGEPLLNKDFILDFSKETLKYCENNNIIYRSSMTTNAYYLTQETFLELFKYNIKAYQITIDGLEEDHNKLRPLSNGKPTFQTIINNLVQISNLADIDFRIVIRVNFNENSNIDKFIEQIKEFNFSNDKRFSFIFRPIQTNWNTMSNDVACKISPTSLQMEYEKKAIENGLTKGDYMLYKDIGSTSCYASRENALIIYPDMSIRKCSIALDDEVNIVGYIDKNSNLIKNKNWNLWTINKYSIHNKSECQSCSFNAQCLSSACPLKFIKNSEIICSEVVYNLEDLSTNIINYIEEI